jgi:hypothetical protein
MTHLRGFERSVVGCARRSQVTRQQQHHRRLGASHRFGSTKAFLFHAKRGVGQGQGGGGTGGTRKCVLGLPRKRHQARNRTISVRAPYRWMNESWEQHCVRAEPTLPFCC